jgi:mono/diheme cytochrome c family protein
MHTRIMRTHVLRRLAPLSLLAAAAIAQGQQADPVADRRWAMFETYCGECHNSTDWAGGVAFDTLTVADVPREAKLWEATAEKLRGHLMPPPGHKQPSPAESQELVTWLQTSLDDNDQAPRAGYTPVQRLNRTEYANAVRSLFGIQIKVEDLLPPEIEMDGFDNIASAQTVSPAFLDQYIGAARIIARQAVGVANPRGGKTLYPAPAGSHADYVEGFPLGTRGGVRFTHYFPADGEYRLNILDLDVGLYPAGAESRQTVVAFVDGNEIFRGDVGGKDDLGLIDREGADGRAKIMSRFQKLPFQSTAGAHEVIVTFVERARALSDEYIGGIGGQNGGDFGGFGRLRLARFLEGVEVEGPFGDTKLSMTPSRQKIFVCQPRSDSMADEEACAQQIAAHLARRAFRRAPTDEDVARLVPYFRTGRKELGTFDGGVQYLVTAVLTSPDFLYRGIKPQPEHGDKPFRLSDVELASRLSFFLWSDIPDEELLGLAIDGKLSQPGVYDAQVRRMLRDPKAASLVRNFAMRWLNVDDLNAVDPDPRLFPAFTEQMRRDFSTEIEMFLASVISEDRSVLRLIDGDYTFLNERLARHYGIPGVYGPQFREVPLADPNRHGLLGKSAVLLRTSYGDRTSPVLRGAWVLERLYGTPATPPPPGVETNLNVKEGEKPTTLRARLEVHRKAQACNSCHGVIDPIGIALENFDVTGEWRDEDSAARAPIDASTVLPSGASIKGPVDLRNEILARPAHFAETMTGRLLMYGVGREVEFFDLPQVRAIVRDAAKDGYRFSDLVLGVVNSDAFRMQSPPHDAGDGKHPTLTTLASVEHPPIPAGSRRE